MTPEQLAAPGTEHAHQTALFCWASQNLDTYPELKWMYAIPNGGERQIAVAGRLKAEGVKSGVSDVCLPVSRNGFHGLYIEMKKPGGTVSAKQTEFGLFLSNQGYAFAICYSWEEAVNVVETYLARI